VKSAEKRHDLFLFRLLCTSLSWWKVVNPLHHLVTTFLCVKHSMLPTWRYVINGLLNVLVNILITTILVDYSVMLRINYFAFCLVSVCNNNSVDIVNQNKQNQRCICQIRHFTAPSIVQHVMRWNHEHFRFNAVKSWTFSFLWHYFKNQRMFRLLLLYLNSIFY